MAGVALVIWLNVDLFKSMLAQLFRSPAETRKMRQICTNHYDIYTTQYEYKNTFVLCICVLYKQV